MEVNIISFPIILDNKGRSLYEPLKIINNTTDKY